MAEQPTNPTRTRVLYISYDGIGEPLGRSQVLSYLFRLAEEHELTLLSYEKPGADRSALRDELTVRGITWVPLSYHRRPPVVSTLMDVLSGVWALRGLAPTGRPDVVHARSYVSMLVALLSRRWTDAKLLFDIRGFWADERVEGGIWPAQVLPYRLLYRVAKRCEAWFFDRADAIVTLTHASLPQIREWTRGSSKPIVVIPTCADLERFTGAEKREGTPHLLWCGSVGTWYRLDLAPKLAEALGWPLDVLTRQTDAAAEALAGRQSSLRSLPPADVPGAMREGDVGLCLYVSSFSRLACAPTRFAEHLGSGMPVVVTSGVGDLESIVEERNVGVVLGGDDEAAIADAADRLRTLVSDPETPDRCRRVAAELFDVDAGARDYARLYAQLAAGS